MSIKSRLTRLAADEDVRQVILNADVDDLAEALGDVLHTTVEVYDDAWTMAHACVVTENGQTWQEAPSDEFRAAAYEFFEENGINANARYVVEVSSTAAYNVYSCIDGDALVNTVTKLAGDNLPALLATLKRS